MQFCNVISSHIPAGRGKTCSERSLIAASAGLSDARLLFKVPGSTLGYWEHSMSFSRTSNSQFYVVYALLMPFFCKLKLPFLKIKQQFYSWIVASGHGENVGDVGAAWARLTWTVCSQSSPPRILRPIRGQQKVLLVLAPVHKRSGAFATDTSHMSVRFYCECKCLGFILSPRRLNVVCVLFFSRHQSLLLLYFAFLYFPLHLVIPVLGFASHLLWGRTGPLP